MDRRLSRGSARQSLGGNASIANDTIKVVCRFRPGREGTNGPAKVGEATITDSKGYERLDSFGLDARTGDVFYGLDAAGHAEKTFTFDHVFGPQTNQAELYNEVSGVVNSVMAGFNGTIMAYGQTSAGKSFSMEGLNLRDPVTQGITPRCINALFAEIAAAEDCWQFQVVVSYFEIYCEKVRDLLEPTKTNLRLRETKNHSFLVQDITEEYVTDVESVFRVIEKGKSNRALAPTLMNAESSRSHSLVTIRVEQKNMTTGRQRQGSLFLVDLAGSEKVGKTGASGQRLEEAKNINGSLTTLGMVINALCDGLPHVPYRDSKLTMVLMDALGGNSKTTLLICCNPETKHAPESLSTLRFGERAKKIKNNARVNEELSVEELKSMLAAARKELALLRGGSDSGAVTPASTPGMGSGEGNTALELERDSLLSERDRLLDELQTLRARIPELEEQADISAATAQASREAAMEGEMRIDALKSTISELEDRLIKQTLSAKKELTAAREAAAAAISNATKNANRALPVPPATTDGGFILVRQELPVPGSPVPKTDEEAARAAAAACLRDSEKMASEVDLQDEINKEISSTSHLLTDAERETRHAQQSAQMYAERYLKLKEEYESHVSRLMLKLKTEQDARLAAEEQLNADHDPFVETTRAPRRRSGIFSMFTGGDDNSPPTRPRAASRSRMSIGRLSFGGGGSKDISDEAQQKIELLEFRLAQVQAEAEHYKEAQSIVLETKESVMRSLARQNSQLAREREDLTQRNEELTDTVGKLMVLLRNLQSSRETSRKAPATGKFGKSLKGGVHVPSDTPPMSPGLTETPTASPVPPSPVEEP